MFVGISWEASRGHVGGSLEASREPLGGLLGASWGLLGAILGPGVRDALTRVDLAYFSGALARALATSLRWIGDGAAALPEL